MKASKSFSSRYHKDLIQEYLSKGAIVLDVRPMSMYEKGHITGSLNIELKDVPRKLEDIKALNQSIITVCVGGVMSAQAEQYLKQKGLDVINGGPWNNVAEVVSNSTVLQNQ